MLRRNILQKAAGFSSFTNIKTSHRLCLSYRFATISVQEAKSQDIIRKALEANEKQQELDRFNEFCDRLYKVYELEEQRKENVHKRDAELLITSLSSKFPMRESLGAYTAYQKGFSDEHLASCLDHVARLYQIFKHQRAYYSDVSLEELLETWKFRDMVDDIRYVLIKGIVASPENLEKIAKGLVKLGYQDHTIQAAFLEKAKRMLNNQDEGLEVNPEEAHELPQYGKRGYYPKQGDISVRELLKNTEFKNYVNKIMTPEEKQTKSSIEDKRTAEIDYLLEKLTRSIKQNQLAQSKLGQAILAVREQFNTLTEVQREKFMAENIFLRSELLELEEFLLEAGLLKIKDIINPQNIVDANLKRQNAANILHNLLLEQKETTLDPTVSQFNDALEKIEKQKKPHQQGTFNPEQLATSFGFDNFARVVATLGDLANVQVGIKLDKEIANEKWKKLLPESNLVNVQQPFDNLEIDFSQFKLPITYSKSWQLTFEFLRSNYESLLKGSTSTGSSLETLDATVNLAYAYSSFYLSAPAKRFLQEAASVQQFINELPIKSFTNLLKTLNYISSTEKNQFGKSILEYVNKHIDELTSEQALEISHALAVQGLGETKEFDNLVVIVNHLEIDNAIAEIEEYHKDLLYDLNLFITHANRKGKNAKATLSENLQAVVFLQKHAVEADPSSKKMTHDPLKESIVSALKTATADRFANLLPDAFARLRERYQPNVFCSDQDGKVGIFVGGGELISIDENELSSLHRFRHSILENMGFNLKCRAVSYNQFLDIDYFGGNVSFKSTESLQNVLDGITIQSKAIVALKEVSYTILDHFNALAGNEATKSTPVLKNFRVFCDQLQNFFATNKEYTSILENGPKLIFNDRIKFQLAYLDAAFKKLDATSQKMVDELAKKQINKDFHGLLQELKQNFTPKSAEAQEGKSAEWFGLLYGEELAAQQKAGTGKKNIDTEILNYPFLWDGDYCSYKDWNDLLNLKLNKNNLNFDEAATGVNNFHAERRITPGLIPNGQRVRNSIKPHSFPWNWEAFSYALPPEFLKKFVAFEQHNLDSQKPLDIALNAMVNLQNLKAEWKASLSDSQLVNKLVELDFIEDLIADHLGKAPKTEQERYHLQCAREPKAYLGYLEKLSRAWVLKDPYTNFFVKEGSRKAAAEALREEYDQKQKDLFKKLENNVINSTQHEMARNSLRDQYMEALEQMFVEQNPKDEIISDIGKKFDIRHDFKSLVKQQDIDKFYNFREDQDYRRADYNEEELLDLKRRKAETKLIKLRLIKKLHEGTPLSAIEKEYVKKWRDSLQSTSLPDLDLNMVPETHSTRSVGTISEKDRQYFGTLDFFDVNAVNTLALNDLVLEIAHFYDESAITRLEKQIKGKQVSQEWGISSSFQFDTAENVEVKLVHDMLEEYAWRRSGEFSTEEREGIHEMFGILRGYTKTDRKWYEVDRKSLDEFIDRINPYDNRQQFLEEWFEKKEREIKHRTRRLGPKNLMQSDDYYRAEDNKRAQDKLKESVELAFNKGYDQISKGEIHVFVENLIERLYMLKKYLPKRLNYIVTGVLEHPNTSVLDRNNLQTALKSQDISIQLDESNVLTLNDVNVSGSRLPEKFSHEEIKVHLSNAKIPFIQDLSKKFQSI